MLARPCSLEKTKVLHDAKTALQGLMPAEKYQNTKK
jgi:hypothetical protein